jgi:hypothetical protein
MAEVLHLWKAGADVSLAADVIAAQLEAGDIVTIAVLDGPAPAAPAGVAVRQLGGDLSYPELVDLIFGAEHVVPR